MVMMSELGCECFLVNTQARKTLKVYVNMSAMKDVQAKNKATQWIFRSTAHIKSI